MFFLSPLVPPGTIRRRSVAGAQSVAATASYPTAVGSALQLQGRYALLCSCKLILTAEFLLVGNDPATATHTPALARLCSAGSCNSTAVALALLTARQEPRSVD